MSDTDSSDCSIYFYNPSLAAAILFTVLYALPTVFTLHRINNYRTWYFFPVVAGGIFEVVGYALRIASTKSPCRTGLYASSQTLIIVAPLLVAAGNYIMLPRLMIAVLPLDFNVIFGLKPLVITAIFLMIDLVSIAIQAVGSGIASTHNWVGSERTTGVDILIAGLAIQVATVIIFLFLCWVFSDRAYFGGGQRPDAPALADRAFKAICISSTLIAVRSIYRLVEFALGIDAYPFTTEWPFYVFEAVPMLGALSIYCLWFPPAYVPRHKFGNPADVEIGKTNGHRTSAPVTPMVQSAAASMLAGQTSPPMARSPAHSVRRHEVPVLRSNNPSRAGSRAGSRATSRAASPVRGHHDTLSPSAASGAHATAHHSHAPAAHEPPIHEALQEAFKPSVERYA